MQIGVPLYAILILKRRVIYRARNRRATFYFI
nr:MAG TPA: hypothetical protein [Caudoviricetes sp.]